MAKYIEIAPAEIEAISFNELVSYGLAHGANIVNGMPWSFHYKGQPVSHETDICYLVLATNTRYGLTKFTPNDMLLSDSEGNLTVMPREQFSRKYALRSIPRRYA